MSLPMEEHENLFEKISEIMGGNPARLRVLEQQIDMDLQLEYYECSRKMQEAVGAEEALEKARYLDEPGYSLQVKKEILAALAGKANVKGYRAIEEYLGKAVDELRDWTLLALNESRMNLESSIMDESQVFISTGLGGKEHKLRYFLVLVSRDNKLLNQVQKKVISNEFHFVLEKYESELEELEFSEYLATLQILVPMECALKTVFQEAICECNKFGDFLKEDFIVTNVKTLSFEEIKEFLRKDGEGA